MDKSDVETWLKIVVTVSLFILFGSIRSCMRGGSNYQQGSTYQTDDYSIERRMQEIQQERERQQDYDSQRP